VYYAKKGDTARGLEFVRRARAIDPSNIQFIYNEAQVRTLAGQTPEALKALREAFEKGYSPQEARNDPELGPLQNLLEYDRLLREFTSAAK